MDKNLKNLWVNKLINKIVFLISGLIICSANIGQLCAIEPIVQVANTRTQISMVSVENREKMFDAIEDQNLAEIRELYNSGISLDPRSYYRSKPLHKAIETRNLNVIRLILRRSQDLPNYTKDCLLNAYAYARQRYDFIQNRSITNGEEFVYREDREICAYLAQKLVDLDVNVDEIDYAAITIYLPMRDEGLVEQNGRLVDIYREPKLKLYYKAGSGIDDKQLIKSLERDPLELEVDDSWLDSAEITRNKLESWSGCEAFRTDLRLDGEVSAVVSPVLGKKLALTVKPGSDLDASDVTVGAECLQAQKLRPARVATSLVPSASLVPAVIESEVAPVSAVASAAHPPRYVFAAQPPRSYGELCTMCTAAVGVVILAALCSRYC